MYTIQPNKKEPIFEQIISQTKHFISLGVLKPNEKMPSVRSLASELGINPNTVAKAYQIMEMQNIIYSSYKRGYFVSDINVKDELIAKLKVEIKEKVQDAKRLNISSKEIITIIKDVYGGDEHD